jgi:hypothetical protein
LVRGGTGRAYCWRGGGEREAWWKEREGEKQEGMVYWRYCVMDDEESVGDESPEGNLVSGALDLNFGR